MARTDIALRAFNEKLAAGIGETLMMPLHWYKKTNKSPLFQLKRKAAIGTLGLGAAGYGFNKLTTPPEVKPVERVGFPG
jgi:hypothetical protein